jgi:hypothetical protein
MHAASLTLSAAAAVTYDFHRLMPGAKLLKCSEFGKAIVNHMCHVTRQAPQRPSCDQLSVSRPALLRCWLFKAALSLWQCCL